MIIQIYTIKCNIGNIILIVFVVNYDTNIIQPFSHSKVLWFILITLYLLVALVSLIFYRFS